MEYGHQLWRDLERGNWAEINPSRCPCNGRGWLLSDFDTFHRCPIHGNGVPHPEDESLPAAFNEPQLIKSQRIAYGMFRDIAERRGLNCNFNDAVRRRLRGTEPQDWVDAAEELATEKLGPENNYPGHEYFNEEQ